MVQCTVPFCNNRSDSQNWKKRKDGNNQKVTFHRFPKNSDSCKLWQDILGIQASVSKTACICSAHFGEQCFDKSGVRVRLRPNALPNANTMEKENLSPNCDQNPLKLSENNATKALSPNTVQYSASAMEVEMACSNDNSTSTELHRLSPQPSTSKKHEATMISPSMEDKATMISPMFAYNSPEKCRLRQRVKFLQTQLRMKMQAMCQKLRRKNNQVLTLKSLLDDMKNKHLLQESQAEVLETLDIIPPSHNRGGDCSLFGPVSHDQVNS